MEPKVLRFVTEQHFRLVKPGPSSHRLHLVPDEIIFHEEGLALKPLAKPCSECGDLVEDRRVTYYLKPSATGRNKWIKKCSGCDLKCPVLKPFDKC